MSSPSGTSFRDTSLLNRIRIRGANASIDTTSLPNRPPPPFRGAPSSRTSSRTTHPNNASHPGNTGNNPVPQTVGVNKAGPPRKKVKRSCERCSERSLFCSGEPGTACTNCHGTHSRCSLAIPRPRPTALIFRELLHHPPTQGSSSSAPATPPTQRQHVALANSLKRKRPADVPSPALNMPPERRSQNAPLPLVIPPATVNAPTPSVPAKPPVTPSTSTKAALSRSIGSPVKSEPPSPTVPPKDTSKPVKTIVPSPTVSTVNDTKVTASTPNNPSSSTAVQSSKVVAGPGDDDMSISNLSSSPPSSPLEKPKTNVTSNAKGKEKAVEVPSPFDTPMEDTNAAAPTTQAAAPNLPLMEPALPEASSSSNANTSSVHISSNTAVTHTSAPAPGPSSETTAPLLIDPFMKLPLPQIPTTATTTTTTNNIDRPTPLQSTKARIKQMVGAAIEEVVKEKLNSLVDDIVDECFLSIAQMLNESFKRP